MRRAPRADRGAGARSRPRNPPAARRYRRRRTPHRKGGERPSIAHERRLGRKVGEQMIAGAADDLRRVDHRAGALGDVLERAVNRASSAETPSASRSTSASTPIGACPSASRRFARPKPLVPVGEEHAAAGVLPSDDAARVHRVPFLDAAQPIGDAGSVAAALELEPGRVDRELVGAKLAGIHRRHGRRRRADHRVVELERILAQPGDLGIVGDVGRARRRRRAVGKISPPRPSAVMPAPRSPFVSAPAAGRMKSRT
jgi:hypothetical protein